MLIDKRAPMPNTSELARLVQDFRAAAQQASALVIASLVSTPKMAITAAVDPDEFLALIQHTRPRVIYIMEQTFNANDYFEDGNLAEHPRVKALGTAWRKHNGQIARVSAAIMVDQVLHMLIQDAPWLEEFEAAAEALEEELDIADDEDPAERAAEERKLIEQKGKILAADPRFVMPKATKSKREHLAGILFPEVDPRLLWAIVDKAESILWLDAASVRP